MHQEQPFPVDGGREAEIGRRSGPKQVLLYYWHGENEQVSPGSQAEHVVDVGTCVGPL